MDKWKKTIMHMGAYPAALGKWVLLGGIIGVAGGVIGSLFHIGVNYATAIRGAHPWILYLLPVGALPSWGCISSAIWRGRAPTPSSSPCISAKACPFSWCR
ncbi:MAG: hypothetical protein ACLR5H_00200 [Oscillospiraceae bacterium]